MPKGIRKISFVFGNAGLTRFGGLVLFQRFCKSLGLRRYLQRSIKWPYIGRHYHPVDLFLAHIFAVVAGLGRIENVKSLSYNGLIPEILGLPNFPHPSTLRDFLMNFKEESLAGFIQSHDRFRKEMLSRPNPLNSAIIDMDATVITVYGKQEGIAVGYNPTHRGKPSYCPLFVSEGRSGLSLAIELRGGSVHPATGAIAHLESALEKLPKTVTVTRTRFRADASFYDKKIIQFLDENRIGYVIVARNTSALMNRISGVRFHPLWKKASIGEFSYHPQGWEKAARFIAIRKIVPQDDTAQASLFAVDGYSYRVAVTNLQIEPLAAWRFYWKRASQELLIREIKNNYSMAKIPTRCLLANKVYFELLLWAYDLVSTFKHLCLPPTCQNWTLHTLQRELWILPAQLVKTENRYCLNFPNRFLNQELFQYVCKRINQIHQIL